MGSLDERLRELDRQVPWYRRINKPSDADRSAASLMLVNAWAAGLPKILIGMIATIVLSVALLWLGGWRVVKLSDARLVSAIRTNIPNADSITENAAIARATALEKELSLLSELIADPVPVETFSWIGRLSFATPPLVRGDRIAALKDLVRLLGDAPPNDRIARLDWLVTLALSAQDARTGLGHALNALSQLPQAVRIEIMADRAAKFSAVAKALGERPASEANLRSLDEELANRQAGLDAEIAKRRSSIEAVRLRNSQVSGIGTTCAAPWRQFDLCARKVLGEGGR